MQKDSEILYKAISRVITKARESKGIKYTDFCYGNDIPMSTYDAIINASVQSSYYNISKIVKALGLTYEEFGKLLDKELPKDYYSEN